MNEVVFLFYGLVEGGRGGDQFVFLCSVCSCGFRFGNGVDGLGDHAKIKLTRPDQARNDS